MTPHNGNIHNGQQYMEDYWDLVGTTQITDEDVLNEFETGGYAGEEMDKAVKGLLEKVKRNRTATLRNGVSDWRPVVGCVYSGSVILSKYTMMQVLLQIGVNVLFLDFDAILLRNPVPGLHALLREKQDHVDKM